MDKLSPETYLKKPYSRILTPEEEGGFSAEILEFPGCFAEGETASEAYEALERTARSWVEAALEQGQEIPEPFNNQGYGGKVALRLPRSIHRQITKMAERDATSLNQFLVAAISMRVGAEDAYTRIAERLERHLTSTITHLASNAATYLQFSNFHLGLTISAPVPQIQKDATNTTKTLQEVT